MPPLHDTPEFACLPELFSTIGHESLIKLCKYAGGETIKIPTLRQLSESVDSLQCYYDVYIKQTYGPEEIPDELVPLVKKIKEVFDAEQG
jgi:hypothetical protein